MSAASPTMEVQRASNFKALLSSYKGEIEKALPRVGLTAERLVRMAVTAGTMDPKLQDCTRVSLIRSILQSAQLGLEPDGVLGKAYLIPYGQECRFQVGYQGLLELARRSKDIKRVRIGVVREGDFFKCEKGLVEVLQHREQDDDLAPAIGYYAIVELISGGIQWDHWSKRKAERHRQLYSKVKSKDGPWEKAFDAMALKSVLIQVLKLCPRTTELEEAARLEAEESGLSSSEVALPNLPLPSLPSPSETSPTSTSATSVSTPSSDGSLPQDMEGIDSHPTSTSDEALLSAKKAAALAKIGQIGQPRATFAASKTSDRDALEREFWAKWNGYPVSAKEEAMERLGVAKVSHTDMSMLSDDMLTALLNEGYVAT